MLDKLLALPIWQVNHKPQKNRHYPELFRNAIPQSRLTLFLHSASEFQIDSMKSWFQRSKPFEASFLACCYRNTNCSLYFNLAFFFSEYGRLLLKQCFLRRNRVVWRVILCSVDSFEEYYRRNYSIEWPSQRPKSLLSRCSLLIKFSVH